MFARVDRRVKQAGKSYDAIRQDIQNIPLDPSLQGLAGAAAKKQMAKLKAYHTHKFRTIMRKYLGVKVNFMSDAVIKPILDLAIKENVDLIKTIPVKYHQQLVGETGKLAVAAPFDQEQL